VRPTLHEVSSDTSEELEAPEGPHITSIAAIGLRGATSKGGWSRELSPNDNVHTLVIVDTDEEIQGVGSVFTSAELVRASLRTLEPLYLGESALEPERLTESAHQHTFWQGRGGAITHTISGIDLAGRTPARRTMPRPGRALRLDVDHRADTTPRRAGRAARSRLPRLQNRLGGLRSA
jgi:hypothetical protein